MSHRQKSRTTDNQPYEAAIAQWRLEVRTEVKRSSSLPTAMFDACDPMLETRLAESMEGMLALLHEPAPQVKDTTAPGDHRMEVVTTDELRELPRRVREGEATGLQLDDGLTSEYLTVLTDACCTGAATARHGACQLLQRDFAIGPTHDLDHATSELWRCLQQPAIGGEVDGAKLADLCQRITAAVVMAAPPAAGTDPA
jgi:hypothetical protein